MGKTRTQAAGDLAWLGQPQKVRFAMVTPEMCRQLTAPQLKFWCCLRTSALMNFQLAKGFFYASYEELAEATGYSRAQTGRLARVLEDTGWLQVRRRGIPHPAGGLANVYVLSLSPEAARQALTRASQK